MFTLGERRKGGENGIGRKEKGKEKDRSPPFSLHLIRT
jgi:hypothetical protein